MKKIIRLTESDLTRIVKRVINENTLNNESCLKQKGFYKDTIGGPMTRRWVYQKEYNNKTYQVAIGKPGEISNFVNVISDNSSQTCSWTCDSSNLGIKLSGCKSEPRNIF